MKKDPRLEAMLAPLRAQDDVFRKKDEEIKQDAKKRRREKYLKVLESQVIVTALVWFDDPSVTNRKILRDAIETLKVAMEK
jgi:hypothetical protein